MTIRNLDAVFEPESVAIIGSSEQPGSVGRVLTQNLLQNFEGRVDLVNPNHRRLFDRSVFRTIEELPEAPDLAVIATPPEVVPEAIKALAQIGTRGACVITAGVGDDSGDGQVSLRQAMLDAARPALLRILGPNSLGLQVPGIGLNASFAHVFANPGSIAFVAQSGALLTAMLDWAGPRGFGFSHIVSMGDMADVDFGDMLDYLAGRNEAKSILLYIESIRHPRKFMSAARAAARTKPVVVVKSGRFEQGALAASSHTGALAGSDGVYDAAFRRAGMLRVFTLEQLFDAVETLATAVPPSGSRLAILTNGGGIGVLATDALIQEGGELAQLSEQTISRLDRVLPPTWSRRNPVDIIGDASGQRYADALEILLDDDDCDAIVILNCPTAVASSSDAAESVVSVLPEKLRKTIMTSWIGGQSTDAPRQLFRGRGIPTYESPEDAVHAYAQMVTYLHNQEMLMETPPSLPELFEADVALARRTVEAALNDRRDWLYAEESIALLNAYGIPTVRTEFASSPKDIANLAKQFDGPVAVKIRSPDIIHKTDVGGVQLNVDPDQCEAVANAMLARVKAAHPGANVRGFTVQAMVHRPGAHELIAGISTDRQFGPVILFGQGGTAVEVIDDTALALPPLNLKLARELIARTGVYRLLQGYRDVAAAKLRDIELVLVRLSYLLVDVPQIEELDINPLLADEHGVVALDARVKVGNTTESGASRLAIRPYPKELEEEFDGGDGRKFRLRPIVPEDEPSLQSAFGRLTPEEVRFRFFMPVKFLDHMMAARFSQIDYDRHMALVLTDSGIPGETRIHAVVRLVEDPDRARAEFAITVNRELAGKGIGTRLMRRILDYARERGIGEVYGDVLDDNERMLKLCRKLGFIRSRSPEEPGVSRLTLPMGQYSG